MTTNYIWKCYEEVKKEMMGSLDNCNTRTENFDDNRGSLVGFFQLLSDRTGTMLNNTALASLSVHAIFLNVLVRPIQRLIGNVNTILLFLAVFCSGELLK